jgi:hypothetical protein
MTDIRELRPVTMPGWLTLKWWLLRLPKKRAEHLVLLYGEPSEDFEWFNARRVIGNVHNQECALVKPASRSKAVTKRGTVERLGDLYCDIP